MKDRMNSPQLYELSRAMPIRLIERAPQGKFGNYVPHFVIVQMLLATVGAYQWELVKILRGPVPGMTTKDGKEYPPLEDAVIGCIYRLTCQVDGETIVIEEVGVADGPAFENNDAGRLKKAASDALKRCAMRLGVGIQLWCKRPDQFFLNNVLRGDEEPDVSDEKTVIGGEEDDEAPFEEVGSPEKPLPTPPTEKATTSSDEHLDPEEVADAFDGEITEPDLTEEWAELLAQCNNAIDPSNNRPTLQKRVRRMYELMEINGLWPEGSLATAISKEPGQVSLTELKKDHLVDFARRTLEWVKARVAKEIATEENDG